MTSTWADGSQPWPWAAVRMTWRLSQDQKYLLVLDTQAGDVTVIQKRTPRKLEPTEYSLLTMIPVGVQPNAIVVKAFMMSEPTKK